MSYTKQQTMGIRGLAGYLKWKVASARTGIHWFTHKGQKWAIDTSCIMYRARAAELSPLTVIAALVVRLKLAGITPVFVFDGRPPMAKTDIIDQRRGHREATLKEITALEYILDTSANMSHMDKALTERRVSDLRAKIPQVTAGDKDQIKKLLYGAGVLFVSASGEADDFLGYLARSGEVQAVISTDMDMLARGVRLLITPETADLTVLTAIHTDKVLTCLGLTYGQFVDASVLMGTDYTGRDFKTMKPADAVAAAKAGIVWPSTAEGDMCKVAASSLHGTGKAVSDLLNETQIAKWIQGPPAREAATIYKMVEEYGWPDNWRGLL